MNFMNEKERIKTVYDKYIKSEKFIKKWSNRNSGNKKINIELEYEIKNILNKKQIDRTDKIILDVGCASGNKLRLLTQLGFIKSNIYGIDIRKKSIEEALIKSPRSHFTMMDARKMLYSNNKFDFINIFTLFSSIISQNNRQKVVMELLRVLKPGGHIIYYDLRYSNPFNPNIKPMTEKNINSLFSCFRIEKKNITLLPPLARNLGSFTNSFYPIFSKISFLNTHFLCLITKK
jgi:ubiquinone/menaquinone biosynthesis C-methylase UbiE